MIYKVNSGLPTTTKIDTLNRQILEIDGKTNRGYFNRYELDSIYTQLGVPRKYLRNQILGNDLATYNNWTHIKAENGYSIWKYTPANYLYDLTNGVYFDNHGLRNLGQASSESATTFSSVMLYDLGSYTYDTVEAGTENGTEFAIMNTTDDYLYIGNATQFYGAKFEFHTRGSGYTLVVEYWNGTNWIALSSGVNGLVDKTNALAGDGTITWNSGSVSSWAQTTVNANTLYFIRISSTTIPTTSAKIFYLIPANNVIGILALSSDDVLSENWAFCSYGSSIYITLRNSGNSLYDGDYYINSNSSDSNKQNFFIYNHQIVADYVNSTWTLVGLTGTGTVVSVAVATANGFAGSVANPYINPIITLSTTITGLLMGNGTAISAITLGSNLTLVGNVLSANTAVSGILSGVSNFTSTGGTTYNLSSGHFTAGSTLVFINGVYQYWGTDYTENGTRTGITTTASVPTGWIVEVRYVPSAT